MRTIAVLVILIATCSAMPSAGAKPRVFQDLTHEKATELAAEEDRLVVIDFTAVWCGPCKQMDRVTWSNASVVKWLRENAVAIQVDVDREPAVARKFRVNAMPTVVVLRDGKEVDRAVGFRDAKGFMKWMLAVKGGSTAAEVREREIAEMPEGPEKAATRMQERMSQAQNLAMMGRNDEALEEYLWLWKNMHKEAPAMDGVGQSFLAGAIARLVIAHPKARIAFEKERDAVAEQLDARPIDQEALADWIVLNETLGENDATLDFVDGFKTEPGAAKALARFEFRLTPLLVAADRWADAGVLVDPAAQLEHIRMMQDSQHAHGAMPDMSGFHIDRLSTQYAALLAAGRTADAETLLEGACELFDDSKVRIACVEKAIAAGQARPEHRDWLDEAAREGHEAVWVRESLDRALAKAPRR